MDNYVCTICGWVYIPSRGDSEGCIPKDTPFEELPPEWVCPVCGVTKDMFNKEK